MKLNLIINHTSMEPIYEQIVAQIKAEVHGKGSFIAAANQELLMEERRKELEKELEAAVQKARTGGLTAKEIRESFEIIMEDEVC